MNDICVYFIWTYEKQILHNYYYQIVTMKFVMQGLILAQSFHLNLSIFLIKTCEL
jgi:hypothetical protein